jgi:hypothetical protein
LLCKKSKVALTSASRRRTLFAALIFALICGRSVEADAPQVINHDEVRGFPDSTSEFLKTYQPYLKVDSGCVPFPAVDAAGNVSGGLKPSGFASDGCSKNLGQIYVRRMSLRASARSCILDSSPRTRSEIGQPMWGLDMIGRMSSYGYQVATAKRTSTRLVTGAIVVTLRRQSRTWMNASTSCVCS